MGITKRRQIKYKQRVRRRQRRGKLKKTGANPNDYFTEGICLGLPKS